MMTVRDIMTSGVVSCKPETNLASAAASMWEHDCGVLPVVDENMHVKGMVTDRDICIALATRNQLASDITVGEVFSGDAFVCGANENVQSALATMRDHKIRRVPVVDEQGALTGIVSIDDIVLVATDKKSTRNSSITYEDAIRTQKAIAERPIVNVTAHYTNQQPAAPAQRPHGHDFDFEE